MRFVLLLLLVIAPAAHAAEPAQPAAATVTGNTAWRSLHLSARREILMAWKALPEATRPPFPVFRDSQIEKMLAPAKPAKTN